eukprot:3161002-Rhodomonas_salina.1
MAYGGTEIAYWGTEIAYRGTEVGYGGTEIGYGGTEIGYVLSLCYAESGTEAAYGAGRWVVHEEFPNALWSRYHPTLALRPVQY